MYHWPVRGAVKNMIAKRAGISKLGRLYLLESRYAIQ